MNQLQLRQAKSTIIWRPDAADAVVFDFQMTSKKADTCARRKQNAYPKRRLRGAGEKQNSGSFDVGSSGHVDQVSEFFCQ